MSSFIEKCIDKKFRKLPLKELIKASVVAISGVSETDALELKKAFNISTIQELAENKYILLTQAVNTLSKFSTTIFDKRFNSKEFEELKKKPIHATSGVSEIDAESLKKTFNIDTIQELAENKYVAIAQVITTAAALEELLSL